MGENAVLAVSVLASSAVLSFSRAAMPKCRHWSVRSISSMSIWTIVRRVTAE